MGYLGNPPTSAAFVTDTFNGTGSQTAYTMSVAPASTASMLVVAGGVLQDPSNYAVNGLTLTFSTAPPAGTGNISVRYMGVPASGVVNTAYRTVTDFTATAGQTTITVPSYTVGFIDVFRNGARLGANDFTATNGTSITLAAAANANDLITTVSFSVSSVLNAIPATPGSVIDTYINSVSASKLTGSRTMPQGVLPAGSVINTQLFTDTSHLDTSSSSWVNLYTFTYNRVAANSKLLVVASVNLLIEGNENSNYRMLSNGNVLEVYNGGIVSSSLSGWSQFQTSFIFSDAVTTGSTTFNFQGAINSIHLYYNYPGIIGSTMSRYLVMEIAA